jgi:AraC family transcriptional regulator
MTTGQTKIDPAALEAPRFEDGKSLLIAGLRGHFTMAQFDGIPALWQRFVSFGRLPNMIGSVYYGLCFPTSDGIDYLCGVEVTSVSGLTPELSHATIPGQRYAVFSHRDHVSKLRNTLDNIWHNWFPSSGHHPVQPAGGAPAFFERYGERFNPQTGMGDIEVWMPIQQEDKR